MWCLYYIQCTHIVNISDIIFLLPVTAVFICNKNTHLSPIFIAGGKERKMHLVNIVMWNDIQLGWLQQKIDCMLQSFRQTVWFDWLKLQIYSMHLYWENVYFIGNWNQNDTLFIYEYREVIALQSFHFIWLEDIRCINIASINKRILNMDWMFTCVLVYHVWW